MSAGISRAMIFSNSVMPEIKAHSRKVKTLQHHQRAGFLFRFRIQASAQVIHNLIAQSLAALTPPFRADELFHAILQSLETDDVGSFADLAAHFIAKGGEEKQL